jgi:hypothetical protein
MKEICGNPTVRKHISDAKKKDYMQNPGLKVLRSTSLKKRYESFEFRCKLRETLVGGFWYGNVKYREDQKSNQKYCEKFNDDFKERVRAYWRWECVVCGINESNRRLHIHHVHYDKEMCCNGSPHDVVALCNSCHMATNYNRELWEKEFTDLIYSEEHNGKCYLTKKEMKTLVQNL